MIRESIVFLREFLLEFETTGACFPTSHWAAEALSAPLRDHDKPINVLEAGPGTGSVTVEILPKLKPGDHLTICEINPRFMRSLKKRLAKNQDYLSRAHQVTFFEGPVQSLPEDRRFDVIVCAIPFLNLSIDLVKDIFNKFKTLGHEETIMTYYEYIGFRSVGKVVSLPERRARLRALDSYFQDTIQKKDLSRETVWLTLLPINVYRLRPAA